MITPLKQEKEAVRQAHDGELGRACVGTPHRTAPAHACMHSDPAGLISPYLVGEIWILRLL